MPNLEEVASSEFPDDAVARIGKVNEIFQKLNATGLAPLPSLTLIPGMSQNDRDDLMKGIEGPRPPTTGSSSMAIASVAEEAINAALGMAGIVANPISQLNEGAIQDTQPKPEMPNTATGEQQPDSSEPIADDPKEVKGKPSNVILVRNMFDKDEETEEGWEEDIRLDFEEESIKHGKIFSVKVMSKDVGGKIYASFETFEAAKACAENLAGRWFDKRQLRVEFVSDVIT